MARTLKSTLNFLVRDPIMDYGPSADYGKCSKEPNWFASSVFMLLPFFCNCLHSLFFYGSLLYHKSTFLRSVPGSFRDFPAPRSAALSARLLRGSGLGFGGALRITRPTKTFPPSRRNISAGSMPTSTGRWSCCVKTSGIWPRSIPR